MIEDYDIVASPWVLQKLKIHGVSLLEVEEALSSSGRITEENRPQHKTCPPTFWCLGETVEGKLLKIVFLIKDNTLYLKTAYEPSDEEVQFYENKN